MWESGELSREFMEWNTVERAIKTETDTRTEQKRRGQARLVYIWDINGNVPTTRWAHRDIGDTDHTHNRLDRKQLIIQSLRVIQIISHWEKRKAFFVWFCLLWILATCLILFVWSCLFVEFISNYEGGLLTQDFAICQSDFHNSTSTLLSIFFTYLLPYCILQLSKCCFK